jgi:hypothetical protein
MALAWHVADLPETRARCDRMVAKRIPRSQYNEHGELLCNFAGCHEPANKSPSYRGLCRRHRKMNLAHKLNGQRKRHGGGTRLKVGPRHA